MQASIDHTVQDKENGEQAVSPQAAPVAESKAAFQVPVSKQLPYDPDGLVGHIVRLGNFWSDKRKDAINATPAFIVNNSSNILGAAHVATEMMMFKASSKDARLIQNPSNPVNWIKEPIQTVFIDTFNRSRSKIPVKELFLEGNPIKNIYKRVTDTEAATLRARANEPGKPVSQVKLSNPWQTRSTLAGLVVWGLSALIPEQREDEQEIERLAVKQQVNPLGYMAERVKQAVWIPEWPQHKRQMIGLGIMASGVCSTIGAWRGRKKFPDGSQAYAFNKGYLQTSLFTLASSFPLLFASDDRRGYGGFGALMMGRLLSLPSSLYTKFRDKESGREWYTAATASFQAENLVQNLIGGAEKMPDGTIVDHTELRQHAREKAKELLRDRKKPSVFAEEGDLPQNVVHTVAHAEKALPELAAQQGQLQTA